MYHHSAKRADTTRLRFAHIIHKNTKRAAKTPEGHYTADWRPTKSQFYKSQHSTYPLDWRNPNGLFNQSRHISYPDANYTAQAQARGVSAGGDVMIHGSSILPQGKPQQALYDYLPREDWTHGCVAVSNQDMDELWANVKNGTKIGIYP